MKISVVGAGIAGLSTAWALTKRGHAVTLLDQGPILNPLSASGDQHRLMRRAYGDADGYARLITEALDAWDELWRDLGADHYANRGVIAINQHPNDGGASFHANWTRGGYRFDTLSPAEAAERWPYLAPATFRAAYYSRDGGALLCQRIGAGLAAWLTAHGATLRPHAAVAGIDPGAGRIALADGEVLEADRIVVAAGAWTPALVPAPIASAASSPAPTPSPRTTSSCAMPRGGCWSSPRVPDTATNSAPRSGAGWRPP